MKDYLEFKEILIKDLKSFQTLLLVSAQNPNYTELARNGWLEDLNVIQKAIRVVEEFSSAVAEGDYY